MITTDIREFENTLRAIIAESPDTVYSAPEHMVQSATDEYGEEVSSQLTCYYVHTDKTGASAEPGCVIGQVLAKLGVPLDTLRQFEGASAHVAIDRTVAFLHDDPLIVGDFSRFARMVQRGQDHGKTWGEALELADEFFGRS